MTIKAIVFDASGTILDDIEAVWRANSDAYSAFGIAACRSIEEFKSKFKMPVSEFHKANGIPPELLIEVDKKFRESYPRYVPLVRLFPEVKGVFEELKARDILLGVASNIPTLFLKEHINRLGIKDYFGAVTGQEDCDEQKPSPKPLLFTFLKLGVKPGKAMYIGDMEEDIIAGKAANTFTAAIVRKESYQPLWRLERQNPDFIMSSLKELLDTRAAHSLGI